MEIREVKPVAPQEIELVAGMARKIWKEHYAGIISEGQIDYMVETFQSSQAIAGQLKDGYRYFWLCYNGTPAGYLAIKEEEDCLFLSKLYIKKEYRGRKLSSCALHYLTGLCRQKGLLRIWLTVNKHNSSSIAAYCHLGFVKTREQVADIGQGYVMDDDIMELSL